MVELKFENSKGQSGENGKYEPLLLAHCSHYKERVREHSTRESADAQRTSCRLQLKEGKREQITLVI